MRLTAGFRLIASLLALLTFQAARAAEAAFPIGTRHVSFTDESRTIKAGGGFAGSPTRRIDVTVWYPAQRESDRAPARAGAWPLLVFGHGTFGRADQFANLAAELVRHGYVVAAPDFPLSSSAAWTKITSADITDVSQQVKDISFIITSLLADPFLAPTIDKDRIAVGGHSLGAVTGYFSAFGAQTRDPRIKAAVLLGAADPVQAALTAPMGLAGTAYSPVSVPVLFLSAEKDLFARIMGRPHAAYSRVQPPKYEVMVRGGAHVWFHDTIDRHPQGKNPDCLFFERMGPQLQVAGCEGPETMIDPARQQQIRQVAVRSFLDGYLKSDAKALARLSALHREFAEAEVLVEAR